MKTAYLCMLLLLANCSFIFVENKPIPHNSRIEKCNPEVILIPIKTEIINGRTYDTYILGKEHDLDYRQALVLRDSAFIRISSIPCGGCPQGGLISVVNRNDTLNVISSYIDLCEALCGFHEYYMKINLNENKYYKLSRVERKDTISYILCKDSLRIKNITENNIYHPKN